MDDKNTNSRRERADGIWCAGKANLGKILMTELIRQGQQHDVQNNKNDEKRKGGR